MAIMVLGIGLMLFPLLLRLAVRLRLGIPLLYGALMLTVFHGWYRANTALADGIFFALAGLAALSWAVTLARKAFGILEDILVDRAMSKALASRVRQARAAGKSVVSTEGLW
ncbi:hypothetical protein [Oscillibacter sp. 1-3]|uniref:hypothetical protein n=1 Tax=Oscillibacter sp. 1-3 TaxID=1235797 RepID=UPI0003359462|nr:hypothetical protein [Oscillibacter sp. 1-3]EOS66270.1 hypothetical protein C816_01316 [Oscillibacter sp. 1-3]